METEHEERKSDAWLMGTNGTLCEGRWRRALPIGDSEGGGTGGKGRREEGRPALVQTEEIEVKGHRGFY